MRSNNGSRRQVAANRGNARKSRGPRTATGKTRASFNAMRHGLAAITRRNPVLSPLVDRIAEAICGDDRNPLLLEQALMIAEHEIVLIGVRAERVAAIERAHDVPPKPIELRDELGAMRRAMPALERLARYERRAWSGRARALCNFIAIKSRRAH
jgi:hypothetical protein